MAVGTQSATHYEREDVTWTFTLDTDVFTGSETIKLVVKATAGAADPPLLGPFTVTPGTGVNTASVSFNVDVDSGTYVYSVRRIDSGFSRELATGTLTVLESAYIDE